MAFNSSGMRKRETKKCLRFLRSSPVTSSPSQNFRRNDMTSETESDAEILKYLSGILKWQHNSHKFKALLNKVTSCAWHSKPLQKYWYNFFRKRQETTYTSLASDQQRWSQTRGSIVVRPSPLEYSPDNIVAAEVLLSRANSNLIGELYARYKTQVNTTGRGGNSSQIHSSFQSSCSSRDGGLMVLDLNPIQVARWHRDRLEQVELSVGVQSLRQYLVSGNSHVDVVNRIEGVIVHFRRTEEEKRRDERRTQLEFIEAIRRSRVRQDSTSSPGNEEGNFVGRRSSPESAGISNGVNRPRRSPRRSQGTLVVDVSRRSPNRPCFVETQQFRVNHTYIRELLNIAWSQRTIRNIGQCSGFCIHPFSAEMNVSAHAVMLHAHKKYICCVPIQYEAFTYLKRIRNQVTGATAIMDAKISNFIASKCGCR